MSKNNKKSKAELRKMEKKRKEQRNKKIFMGITLAFIVGVTAFYILSSMGVEENNIEFSPVSDANEISETQISIPLSSISTEASFYKYEYQGTDIHYFAVKEDGDVHVALDACDVCYHAKQGYRQVGNEMECINCGLTFPIEDIGEKNTAGGCWPSFIPITITDSNILIEKAKLEEKVFMFA